MNRLSPEKTKRFVVILFSSFVAVALLSVYLIVKGRSDAEFQAKLQSIRQQMMPAQVVQEMKPRQDYVQAAQKLSDYIRYQMNDKKLPGLTIALADENQIVWSKGFGVADSASKVNATPQTVYRVASVSKLFTAVAAMKLVEKGKLGLDADIADYDPKLKFRSPFADSITIRQLMSHRSGIVREPAVGSYFDEKNPELEKSIQSLIGTQLILRPSSETKYSNAAVTLLGYLIQKKGGEKYADFMQKQILEPLGMKESSFKPEPILKRRTATGYMWSYDGRSFKAPTFSMGIDPAAGLLTTMPDLCRFMSMLFANGKLPDGSNLVSERTLQEMWKPQFTDAKRGFGLGFLVTQYKNHLRVQHGGVQYGHATQFAAFPNEKIGVAVATNLDNANAVINQIANYASDLMLAIKTNKPLPDAPMTQDVPQDRAAKLHGFYQKDGNIIELSSRSGKLTLYSQPYQYRVQMKNDTLVTDSRLGFGTQILPKGYDVEMNGELYQRIDFANAKAEAFSYPTRLKEYLGEYGEAHNILFVYPKYGKMMARIEWFDDYPLHEMGRDFFQFPADGLYNYEEVKFKRGKDGKIEGVYAAGVYFRRRSGLTHKWLQGNPRFADEKNEVFYIKPQKPQADLLEIALKGSPPAENGDFVSADLIEPSALDRTILVDIRYASNRNFMGMRFYDAPRAFLQRPAAEAVVRAHQSLKAQGLGLLIHDAYRPWYVTKMFWDATPQAQRDFVANPAKGSRHNRGCAVDLTLYDLKTGKAVEMPSLYDEFSPRAYPNYGGGTPEQNRFRAILNSAMLAQGFTRNESEWWHFDYKDWERYPIGNKRFHEL